MILICIGVIAFNFGFKKEYRMKKDDDVFEKEHGHDEAHEQCTVSLILAANMQVMSEIYANLRFFKSPRPQILRFIYMISAVDYRSISAL